MAKDITLKTRNGETRYPKSVTALIYENGTGKTLQTIIDEMRQVDADTNTRTQHFKADVNNLDTLKNKTDIGLYNYVGTGWRGSVSVCYDSADNVSQVALSSSTPSYNGNTLTWISAQPCAMARTYTNGAWSHWEKVGAPVVNDLTTGGTDKALSAEMGKTLKEGLDALGPKIEQVTGVIKQDSNRFVIKDSNKNIAFIIDAVGIKGRKFIVCDESGEVVKILDGSVLKVADIEDSVNSESATKALSAKQGNLLHLRILDLESLPNSNISDNYKDQFIVKDASGNYALRILADGTTELVISKDSFVNAFDKYKNFLPLPSTKTDISLVLPPYLFSVANYCYSDEPQKGSYVGSPSKRNYAPVIYLDRLVKLGNDGFPPNVTFLGGKTSMRIANTSDDNSTSGGQFSGTSKTWIVKNRIVGEAYNDYDVSIPLHVAKNTNLLDYEQTLGRHLNLLCFGDSETDQGEWSSYIRKLVLMDNMDYKKKTNTSADVMDVRLVGTMRDTNNESFSYRGESVTTPTGNYNEGLGSWACYTFLRHAKLYTWASVTYNSTSKSILHCAWRELGLYSTQGREYGGTDADKLLIANTCSGYNTLTIDDLDGWVWNNNRNAIGLSSVEWGNATSENKSAMLTYLNVTLLNSPSNKFYSKNMVTQTNGEYAFSWDAYYARYKTHDVDGSILATQGTDAISNSYVCTPDYVLMNLGTNDGAAIPTAQDKMEIVYFMAQLLHTQIGCPVIVFTPSFTSRLYMSGAEDGYAEAQRKYLPTIQATQDNTIEMMSLFGTLAQQESNGIYFCPTYWTQRFGTFSSIGYVEIGEDVTEVGTIVNDNEVHPSKKSYDDWGFQLYSMINYILR